MGADGDDKTYELDLALPFLVGVVMTSVYSSTRAYSEGKESVQMWISSGSDLSRDFVKSLSPISSNRVNKF